MADKAKYVTLTEDNFRSEVLESREPVLVDFWASWCGPCLAIAPTVEQLAAEYEGRAKVAKVNVDQYGAIAAQYGIHSIPALLYFRNGKVVDSTVGVAPKAHLAQKLDSLIMN
jgi:thioredoxin 1